MVGPLDRQCADHARDRGDPAMGTTPSNAGWLLVEHPAPWGVDAVSSALGTEAAAELHRRAHESNCRVLMIRRPGRARRAGICWYRVDRASGATRSGAVESVHQLLDLPWHAGGAAEQRRILLVCAHGRHDTCCARYGRPIAGLFATMRPDDVWECSHVGGDRFAANVLSLPTGDMYGYVTPLDVGDIVEAIDRDQPVWTKWRGRSDLTTMEQAAVSFLGLSGLITAAPLRRDVTSRPHADHVDVDITGDATGYQVRVRTSMRPAEFLTCRSAQGSHSRAFDFELTGGSVR